MTVPLQRPDISARPEEIEEPLNRWLIHPVARRLVPVAIASGLSPNALSLLGMACGVLAGYAYSQWSDWRMALAGFAAMLGWHVCDALDGMVARATGRASAFGRFLDGVCDYVVFIAVYLALAASVTPTLGFATAFGLALLAGAAHAVQSAYYEAQRELYVRRLAGLGGLAERAVVGGILERAYNRGQAAMTASAGCTDAWLRGRAGNIQRYRSLLAPMLKGASLLGQTARTLAIVIACLAGSPILYWLWEIVVLLPAILLIDAVRRRREADLVT
jgi:phosphatidylglycerophosphate synthase